MAELKLINAIIIGIITVIIGSLIGYIMGQVSHISVPNLCKEWNKYHIMEITLFATGVMLYFASNLLGFNM